MSEQKLRFALVGLDHWYTAIELAHTLTANPRVELVGIADADEARAKQVADEVGLTEYTSDLHKYINDPSVDVIGSFVTIDRNPEIVIAAAEAGKHILSVKPFALTLEEGTRIVDAVRKAGVTFVPAETRLRQSELNQFTRDLVVDGKLGELVSGNFNLISSPPQNWPDAPNDGGWWADPDKVPGGGWVDHSIYQVDRLRWILGKEVVRVTGRTANLVQKQMGVEDYGHAIIEFDGGSMFSIEDTWSGPPSSWRITTVLIGTEGAMSLDTISPNISTYNVDGREGWTTQPVLPDDSSDLDPLIDHYLGIDTSLFGDERDAWENLAVCLAFYESAKSGQPADVKHLD